MLTPKRAVIAALTIVLSGLITSSVFGQQQTFYLDRAQLSGAPDDGFMVWRPQYMYNRTRFYGTTALGFSYNPLRADTVTRDPQVADDIENPVQGQFIQYFMIGTEVANRLGFGVSLPVAWYTIYGDNPTAQGVTFDAGDKIGLHDLRLDIRARVYESNNKKLRLGLGGAVFAPTGNSAGALAGDNATSGYFFGAGEIDFGKFFLAGNLGPHFRPSPRGIREVDNQYSVGIGNELRWAFGAYLPLRDKKIRLGLELWGTTGTEQVQGRSTFFAERNTDLEWLAQGRMTLDKKGQIYAMAGLGTRLLTSGYGAPDFRVLASIGYWFTVQETNPRTPGPKYKAPDVSDRESDRDGDGYPDDIDKCPDIPEDGKPPFPSDGCPVGADRDGDGIPDAQDACPDVPEDKDGVEDTDGCPEDDADGDGVPDAEDKCPTVPGPASKTAERNGCPSIKYEAGGDIQLLEPIQFETGKATIKPESYHILDEVVSLLKSHPELRVGVYGHTDSVGSDASNLILSKNRAAACMKYLIGHGIKASRLESEGFGESQPIDTNATPAGRARNRRTEFKVLD